KVVRMIGTVQDITEQKNAEQKIKRLSDRVLLATEIANLGVWEFDREKNEIYWEDQMYSIFSDADKPLNFEEVDRYFLGEHKKIFRNNLQMIRSGINFLESEVRVKVEQSEKYLRTFTRVLRNQKGEMKGLIGVVYDITSDKKLQLRLESSLEEKNVLIKEVHHRVKNNLQLISSILALKSFDLEENKSKDIFNEVNDRIKAMSVIHDKLYTFYNVSEIDISEYLNHIAGELQILLGTSDVHLSVESENLVFDVEKALLIGLIVSELVSNAIKHGFDSNQEGEIRILFNQIEENYILRVLNSGKVLPQDVLERSTGLGISLLKTFTKQLRGEVTKDEENGFRVSF
ncbi:MAG: histidine kinase dimerization/phosphoacceptor domain -containing protein, partial [Bacteroidota bacterium]